MNFKHVKFDDSPVMRSLEQVAIAKKMFPADKAPLRKEATPKVALTLSDNLFGLVSSLRDKGLVAEANSLEDKFYQFKTAEKHLYKCFEEDGSDLLDFAHPDGEFEVAPAKDGLGRVETLESGHAKMVEMVQKQPTGKFASLVSEILGVKTAQEVELPKAAPNAVPVKTDADRAEELAAVTIDPKTKGKVNLANEILNANWPKIDQLIQSTVASFGLSDENLKFVEPNLVAGIGIDIYAANAGNAEITAEKIADFQKLRKILRAGGDSEVDAKSIAATITEKSSNPAGLLAWGQTVSPANAATFFKGCVVPEALVGSIKLPATKDIRFSDVNPYSVWYLDSQTMASDEGNALQEAVSKAIESAGGKVFLNPARVNQAATIIYMEYLAKKNALFGEEALDKATKSVKAKIAIFANSLPKGFAGLVQPMISYSNPTTSLVSGRLETAIDLAGKFIAEFNKNILPLYAAMAASAFAQNVVSGLLSIQNFCPKLNEEITKLQINKVQDGVASIISGSDTTLANSIRALNNFIDPKKNPNYKDITPKQLSAINNNIGIAMRLYQGLEAKNKPYGYLIRSLPNDLPAGMVESFSEDPAKMAEWADEFANSTEKVTNTTVERGALSVYDLPDGGSVEPPPAKKASQSPSLTKEGQAGTADMGGGGTKKPAPTGGKAPSGGGYSAPIGMGKADLNDPAQAAVANMQLALNTLGRYIGVETNKSRFPKLTNYDAKDGLTIIGTGPKSNPQLNNFDGKWSQNTSNALKVAAKYLNSLGLNLNTETKWNQATKSHADNTASAANSNTSVLNKANAYLSGDPNVLAEFAILDELPTTIHWESGPEAASAVNYKWNEGGLIKVTRNELASLGSFYEFLTRSGLRQPEVSEASEMSIGTEGFTPTTWNQTLQWFLRRSVFKYNLLKSEGGEAKGMAIMYHQLVQRLNDQYKKIVSYFAGKLKPDQVIPSGMIREFSRSNSGGRPGSKDNFMSNRSYPEDGAGSGYPWKHNTKLGPPAGSNSRSPLDGSRTPRFNEDGSYQDEEDDTALPFDNFIDLGKSRWADFDSSGLNTDSLRLKDFLRTPGKRMAGSLFAGARLSQEAAEFAAAKKRGRKAVDYDPQLGVMMQQGASLVPIFTPAERQQITSMSLPLNKYQEFLNNLSTNLHQVMRGWIDETRPSQATKDNLQGFYQEWQRAIIKQLQDLQRG